MGSITKRILKFTASLKLAVIVIVLIGIISAVGTIYEARYDAEVAQQLVYHSIWMYVIMGLLCVNLIGVMIDRWPWRQHHAGFVLAHIGIIILLAGSVITQKYGIDGSIAFGIGEEKRHVLIRERDLMVYASFDGNRMQNVYFGQPEFLKNPPTEEKPFVVNLGSDRMEFVEYHQFAIRESEIVPSDDPKDQPAIRFQLENPNVNVTEWLRRERGRGELELGPARVVFTDGKPEPTGRNEIYIITTKEGGLRYAVIGKDRVVRKTGALKQSDTIDTGWMGLKFRLLRHLPHAREDVRYTPSGSSPIANSAVRFRFQGRDYWLGLNSALRIYLEDRLYLVSYGHRQHELKFPLKLDDFRVGKFQGTERASSYESVVTVPGMDRVLISMNEPLKFEGYTFYQASFEKDEMGRPVASILSVNRDPGRWIKYIGSMLMVLGSVVLFYFKRVQWIKKGTSE